MRITFFNILFCSSRSPRSLFCKSCSDCFSWFKLPLLNWAHLPFSFLLQNTGLALFMCFLFRAGTFGLVPILNSKIILSAPEAPALSRTSAASVFNLANALGATLGTVLLNVGFTYAMITFVASGMIAFGMILTIFMNRFEYKPYFQIEK